MCNLVYPLMVLTMSYQKVILYRVLANDPNQQLFLLATTITLFNVNNLSIIKLY